MKTIYYHVYSFYSSSRMTFKYVSSNKSDAEGEASKIDNGYATIIKRYYIDESDIYVN